MITYNTLKEIQKNERSSSELSHIPENFYEQCSNFFYNNLHKDMSFLDIRMVRNAYSTYREIVERRLNKISSKAYFIVVSINKLNKKPPAKNMEDALPINIISMEKNIFYKTIDLLDNFYYKIFEEYNKSELSESK